MTEIGNTPTTKLERRLSRGIGGAILLIVGLVLLVWIRSLPPEQPAAVANVTTAVWSPYVRQRTSGPILINQDGWMSCPPINPAKQEILIHIVENNVWIDWWIDGRLYQEKPKYFPDHKDVVVQDGSSFSCRVTPGTAVRTATVSWTITDH